MDFIPEAFCQKSDALLEDELAGHFGILARVANDGGTSSMNSLKPNREVLIVSVQMPSTASWWTDR